MLARHEPLPRVPHRRGRVGVAIAAMLVRRRAPEGSFFSDGDRASGVFGVLATGFSVLLGFIIFLAFTSYDQSRAGAEAEALVLVQQVETAQFFPPDLGEELTGELTCYGRSVATVEWDQMEAGTQRGEVSLWAVELFDTLHEYEPKSASEQSAYDRWLDQTSTREEARRDRIHGAVGIIPSPLGWCSSSSRASSSSTCSSSQTAASGRRRGRS